MQDIKDMIFTIRGKQVMLDSDVAAQYDYETKRVNETVKRNIKRFPTTFCFQLTEEEYDILLRSQIVTSRLDCTMSLRSQTATLNKSGNKTGMHIKYLPSVFTEQGIAMLSGLLKSEIAIKVSVNIMNAFVEMRKFVLNNAIIFERLTNLEYKILEHDNKFDILFDELQKEEGFKQKIFFAGQIYDAHSLIVQIITEAKSKIVIIDNYISGEVLDMISRKNKDVIVHIITGENKAITENDIKKFNSQYPKLTLTNSKMFHDRFVIIDDYKIYHIGASLKDVDKKCFAINEIKDEFFTYEINQIIERGYLYRKL